MTPTQRDAANVRNALRFMTPTSVRVEAQNPVHPHWARRIYREELERLEGSVPALEFTTAERAMLVHRLAAGDCIADALSEHPYERDEVEQAADILRDRVEGCGYVLGPFSALELDVLADAVDGSTWAVCLGDDAAPALKAAANRTLRSAAAKLTDAGAVVAQLPTV